MFECCRDTRGAFTVSEFRFDDLRIWDCSECAYVKRHSTRVEYYCY